MPLVTLVGKAGTGKTLLALAAGLPFDRDARKVVILITDETTDIPDGEIFSTDEVVARLKAAHVDEVDVVTLATLTKDYAFLSAAAPGKFFTMDRYGRQTEGLANLFREVAVAVADSSVLRGTGVPGAKVDVALIRKNFWPDALQAGLWVGLVCFGIGVAVETFQQLLLGEGDGQPVDLFARAAVRRPRLDVWQGAQRGEDALPQGAVHPGVPEHLHFPAGQRPNQRLRHRGVVEHERDE